jgi:hypothetical protein
METTAHDIEIHDGKELKETSMIPEEIPEDSEFWSKLDALGNPYVNDDPSFAEKRLKRESPKHRAAFLYWCRLHSGFRTDAAVADKYKVSRAMVGKWRKSFNWEYRLEVISNEDAKRQLEVSNRTVADDINLILGAGKEAIDVFLLDVRDGKVTITPKDFVAIGEMMLRLRDAGSQANDSPGSNSGNSPLDKLERMFNSIGDNGAQVLVKALQVEVGGDIPADRLAKAQARKMEQDAIGITEIGDTADQVEFNDDVQWTDSITAEGD